MAMQAATSIIKKIKFLFNRVKKMRVLGRFEKMFPKVITEFYFYF